MKNPSIESRIRALLVAFALLVVISVGITFWGLEAQKSAAQVINIAGRQRMLVQWMTRLAQQAGSEAAPQHFSDLASVIHLFEQSQAAIRNGGQAVELSGENLTLPAARNPRVLASLDEVDGDWAAFYTSLEALRTTTPDSPPASSALAEIQMQSPILLAATDRAVVEMENNWRRNVNRLNAVQAGFLSAALLLLLAGRWMTRRSVTAPLAELGRAAGRIGAGDLDSAVQVSGPPEIQALSQTLESMRTQIKTAEERLRAVNETLEERVTRRTREQEALYNVSREISSRLDIQHVLTTVTTTAKDLLGSDAAYLCLLDTQGGWMNLQAASGPAEAVVECSSPTDAQFVEHVLSHPGAVDGASLVGCPGACEIMAPAYRSSHLAAPLRAGERVIGALCVGSRRANAFEPDALRQLTRLAGAAAVAMENARLYAQAERTATLEERQRLAAEMHDGLAQTLSFLQMNIDLARTQLEAGQTDVSLQVLERSQRAVDQGSQEIRRAIASLQETFPLHYTLQEQLTTLVDEFSVPGKVVDCILEVKEPLALSRDLSEQVLRVVREALVNARNHSQARCIEVCLRREGDDYQVEIADDGLGFDPNSLPCDDGRPHFGINIMHARAARMGGSLAIESGGGFGTRVILTWPQSGATERRASPGDGL